MPHIKYRDYKPQAETREIIEDANTILRAYAQDGFNLTVRQLYYQFIARDLFPASYVNSEGTKNNEQSYNKLVRIVSAAREAGMIDWRFITDRGRQAQSHPHWADPQDFLDKVAPQFRIDLWDDQPTRIEVWVEKDALSDVIERACAPFDVPFIACKGYMSVSAIWEAAHDRILQHWNMYEQPTKVLHLGDHDPSGIDMTRDIQRRLDQFTSQYQEGFEDMPCEVYVDRIALTMDQVDEYNPPPNPAKETDSRFTAYDNIYGSQSWELDALEPSVLVELIQTHIRDTMDIPTFENRQDLQDAWRENLVAVADKWPDVATYLETLE